MRIIDKHTDFYDYWQNVYPDNSITFDRTDSFLLTKDVFCEYLRIPSNWYRYITKECEPYSFALLQVCNTFWLFLIEITKEDNNLPVDYNIELLVTWKNYNKPRELIKLDIISFYLSVSWFFYRKAHDKEMIKKEVETLIQAIDTNDFKVERSISEYAVPMGGNTKVNKHIPILKASGIGECINSLDIYLAFEEYFSLEKTSSERTTSVGLTDKEKIENHGFDVKTSFRGKQ